MIPNQISYEISDKVLEEIQAHLDAIEARLPFLVGLSAHRRKTMLKAGDQSQVFSRKAMVVGHKIQDYLPRALDLDEMRKDIELVDALHPLQLRLSQLARKMSDTCALASSEAYAAALLIYRTAKQVEGPMGLSRSVAGLSTRFHRRTAVTRAAGTEPDPADDAET